MIPGPEADLQKRIEALARAHGWLIYHAPTLRSHWQARNKTRGFPDLVLAHPERRQVYFLEIKADRGRTTEAQGAWCYALDGKQTVACVVTPAEEAWVERVLSS